MGGFGAGLQILGEGVSRTADRLLDLKLQQERDAVEERRYQEKKQLEADAAAFYERMQQREDARAETRLGFDKAQFEVNQQKWTAELEDLQTKADAEATFREKTGLSPEAFALLSEQEKHAAYMESQRAAAASSRMNRDLAAFNLEQSKRLAPLEERSSAANATRAEQEAGRASAEQQQAWEQLKEWREQKPQRVTSGLMELVDRQTQLDRGRLELHDLRSRVTDAERRKRLDMLQENLTNVQGAVRSVIEQRMSSRNAETGEPDRVMEQALAPTENRLLLQQEELVKRLVEELQLGDGQ